MSAGESRVFFFGDSLVAGKGDPDGLGWVGRLDAVAVAGGHPFIARNFGVPGETSTQICARWRRQAEAEIDDAANCRVVFSFGANDTTEESGQLRVPADVSCRNLEVAIETANELKLPVLIVGPAPVNDDAQHRRIEMLSDAFAAICADRAVPFIPVERELIAQGEWVAEARAGDGAHPGRGGYDVITGLIRPALFDWMADHSLAPAPRTGS